MSRSDDDYRIGERQTLRMVVRWLGDALEAMPDQEPGKPRILHVAQARQCVQEASAALDSLISDLLEDRARPPNAR